MIIQSTHLHLQSACYCQLELYHACMRHVKEIAYVAVQHDHEEHMALPENVE